MGKRYPTPVSSKCWVFRSVLDNLFPHSSYCTGTITTNTNIKVYVPIPISRYTTISIKTANMNIYTWPLYRFSLATCFCAIGSSSSRHLPNTISHGYMMIWTQAWLIHGHTRGQGPWRHQLVAFLCSQMAETWFMQPTNKCNKQTSSKTGPLTSFKWWNNWNNSKEELWYDGAYLNVPRRPVTWDRALPPRHGQG